MKSIKEYIFETNFGLKFGVNKESDNNDKFTKALFNYFNEGEKNDIFKIGNNTNTSINQYGIAISIDTDHYLGFYKNGFATWKWDNTGKPIVNKLTENQVKKIINDLQDKEMNLWIVYKTYYTNKDMTKYSKYSLSKIVNAYNCRLSIYDMRKIKLEAFFKGNKSDLTNLINYLKENI